MAPDNIRSLTEQAEKAFRSGQFIQAAEIFQQAAERSTADGDSLRAAELANNRSVALLQASDAEGALQASLGTDLSFAQAGDSRRQGLALGNQAAALEGLERLAEALDHYQRSADLLKQSGDSESRAAVLKSISALQVRTGHHLEALASMDAALNNQARQSLKERLLKKLLHIPFKMMGRG